jgi:hypothetical protein
MQTNNLQPKLEALVSRYRGTQRNPTPAEIEELYTEGCAELLRLETKMLRLKRKLVAAEADSPDDPVAARRATELRRSRSDVGQELAALRALVRLLRSAVDWAGAFAPSGLAAANGSQAARVPE